MSEPVPFGQYLLVERLGKGGMAEVFLAVERHQYGVDRFVVIKRMLPKLCRSPKFVRMFLTEAQVVALLSHPNIVPVYEMGRCAGYYFIAMQHVPGINISKLLALANKQGEAHLPLGFGIGVAREVLRGLDYAHRGTAVDGTPLDVVHRDVSPSNVIVSFTGDVKLLDFGVSTSMLNVDSASPIAGKHRYMSPEVASGQAVDGRADLFSLGLVLYELLVGHGPFESDEPKEVLLRLVTEALPKPSEFRPEIPGELDEIILWATAREPGRRPESAGELAEALLDVAQRYAYDIGPAERERVLGTLVPPERMKSPTVSPPPKMRAAVLAPGQQAAALTEPLGDVGFDTRHYESSAAAKAALREDAGTQLVVTRGSSSDAIELLCWVASNHPSCHRLMILDSPDSAVLMRAINEAKVDRVFVSPVEEADLRSTLQGIMDQIRGDAVAMESVDVELEVLMEEPAGESDEAPTLAARPNSETPAEIVERAATEVERALQLCDRVSVIGLQVANGLDRDLKKRVDEQLRELTRSMIVDGDTAFWAGPDRLLLVQCERGQQEAQETIDRICRELDDSLGKGSVELPWAVASVPDQYGSALDAVVGVYWQLASQAG